MAKDWQYLLAGASVLGLYALIRGLKAEGEVIIDPDIPSPVSNAWEDLVVVATPEQRKVMRFCDLIMRKGMFNAVEPALIAATIGTESSGDPDAFRWEGVTWGYSYGLMQILYPTAQQMGYEGNPQGLFDPDTNIEYGARYLRHQRTRYKTLAEAIAAYNAGTATWTEYGRLTNATYVQRVLDRIPGYRSLLALVYPNYRQVVNWEDDLTQPSDVKLPWWPPWG
jgi:soluble lytic murein transglycosylase-like protein